MRSGDVFGLGMGELLVFALVVLLLFGQRIPAAMKSLGQSVQALKQGLRDDGNLLS